MTRILHVMTSPRAEGTPRLALDWLSSAGHEQGVAFLSPEPADLIEQFRAAARWMRVGDCLAKGPRKFTRIARFSGECACEFQPDLVIAWPLGFSHWIFMGVRSRGCRAALLSHAGNPPGSGLVSKYLMTWACLWATTMCGGRVIACSAYVRRKFTELPLVPSSSVGFAYNSVQAASISERAERARRARSPTCRFQAIMVATLESHKDHRTLILAARILRDRAANITVVIVGSGSLADPLRALAGGLVESGHVQFLGMRDDVPELLGQSDVFVLSTTRNEGRPGVLLEALAAGLPIVASDVEPVRELLEDGHLGALVPAADPTALADALIAMQKAGSLDLAEVRRLQTHAARFVPRRMISDYLREAKLTSERVGA
jgi:glycosyltransferase involved in cell wall biosynthesis